MKIVIKIARKLRKNFFKKLEFFRDIISKIKTIKPTLKLNSCHSTKYVPWTAVFESIKFGKS